METTNQNHYQSGDCNHPNHPNCPDPAHGVILNAWRKMAAETECVCRPYRGGTTHALHLPFCGWNGKLDGFLSLAEAFGVSLDALPALVLPDGQVCASQEDQGGGSTSSGVGSGIGSGIGSRVSPSPEGPSREWELSWFSY